MSNSEEPPLEEKKSYFKFLMTVGFIVIFGLLIFAIVFIDEVVPFDKTKVEMTDILLILIVIFLTIITHDIKKSLRRPYETTNESIGKLRETTNESIGKLRDTIKEDIKDRVDLQCKFNTIAKRIDAIVRGINKLGSSHPKTERAVKRLNGVEQIFTKTEVTAGTAIKALKALDDAQLSLHAVSTAAIAESLDPIWLKYFIEQVFKCNTKISSDADTFSIAERYFVYDPEIIHDYLEELATLKRVHALGKILFIVLDAKELRMNVNNILQKLDQKDTKLLESTQNSIIHNTSISSSISTGGVIPDFLLLDGDLKQSSVFPRDKYGKVKPSNDQKECAYYSALTKFFQEASKIPSIKKEIPG